MRYKIYQKLDDNRGEFIGRKFFKPKNKFIMKVKMFHMGQIVKKDYMYKVIKENKKIIIVREAKANEIV